MTLMERRRALMGGKTKTTPILLTNGSYANGKIIVTNGNHVATSGPAQGSYYVTFSKSFSVVTGDIFEIKWSGTSNVKNRKFGFRVNDSVTQWINTSRPNANTWYSITISTDGLVDSLAINAGEVGWIAEMDISIRLNGEVLF